MCQCSSDKLGQDCTIAAVQMYLFQSVQIVIPPRSQIYAYFQGKETDNIRQQDVVMFFTQIRDPYQRMIYGVATSINGSVPTFYRQNYNFLKSEINLKDVCRIENAELVDQRGQYVKWLFLFENQHQANYQYIMVKWELYQSSGVVNQLPDASMSIIYLLLGAALAILIVWIVIIIFKIRTQRLLEV